MTSSHAASIQIVSDGRPQGTQAGKSTTQPLGFYGTTPITQPTVEGFDSEGIAIDVLLDALDTMGLINDAT